MAKEFIITPGTESGATMRRAVGGTQLKMLDPFVQFLDFTMSPPAGFRDHPHRAFESATYVLEGGIAYSDFRGFKATFDVGDVQWITTGKAIIHSEMPAYSRVNRALQLWVNYPNLEKMGSKTKYLEVKSGRMPLTRTNGVEIKQIAGGRSTNFTEIPIMFLDFTLSPGAKTNQKIPMGWNAFVYVLQGQGKFGSLTSTPVSSSSGNNSLIVLDRNQYGFDVANVSNVPLRFVLVGGRPMNEPVVTVGPFVMRTQAEIDQAIKDYKTRTNGFEAQKKQ